MSARSPSPGPAKRGGAEVLRRRSDCGVYRSGGGADSPQRSAAGKNLTQRAPFDKENIKSGVRSPATTTSTPRSGGAKSFMAPTISAASKAVGVAGASPRKKILSERNSEDVLPETKPPHNFPAGAGGELKRMEDSEAAKCRSPAPIVAQGSPAPVLAQGSPACAIEADPHLPPYDPKTNYLSPRPRFLHYRPNPRVEQYLHSGGGDALLFQDEESPEGSVTSDSCSDESSKSEEEGSFNADHRTGEFISGPTVEMAAAPGTPVDAAAHESESKKPEESAHSGSSTRSKPRSLLKLLLALPLLLLLLVAGVCIMLPATPAFSSIQMPVHSVAQVWMDSLSPYLAALRLPIPEKEFVSYPVANLSSVVAVETFDPKFFAPKKQEEACAWPRKSLAGEEYPSEQTSEEVNNEGGITAEQGVAAEAVKEVVLEMAEEEGHSEELFLPTAADADEMEQPSTDDGVVKEEESGGLSSNGGEMQASEHSEEEVPASNVDRLEISTDASMAQIEEPGNADRLDAGDELQSNVVEQEMLLTNPTTAAGGIFKWPAVAIATFMVVAAAAAFTFATRKKQQPVAVVPAACAQTEAAKKMVVDEMSTSGSSGGAAPSYQLSSADSETVGDAGPAEYSSSLHNESLETYERRRTRRAMGEEEEMMSSADAKLRRESAVSSSPATSYGSFTTYEKIPVKKGGSKEEEAMTPVRRSSRIRSQVVATP